MSRATVDDQLKFLLSCVRHSNYGRIDFVEVANECSIVSKGAAAKRYERLLRSIDAQPNQEKSWSSPTPKVKSRATIAKEAAAKRRKIEGDDCDMLDDDDEDIKPVLVQSEPQNNILVKSEHTDGPTSQSFYPLPTFMPHAQGVFTHVMPQPGLSLGSAPSRHQTYPGQASSVSQNPYASTSMVSPMFRTSQSHQTLGGSAADRRFISSTSITQNAPIPRVTTDMEHNGVQRSSIAPNELAAVMMSDLPPDVDPALSAPVAATPRQLVPHIKDDKETRNLVAQPSTSKQSPGNPQQDHQPDREYILISD